MKFYVRYCLGAIRIRAGQGVIGLLRTRGQLAAARGRSLVEQEVRGAEALFSRRGGAHAYVVEDICDLAYGNLYAIARRDAREALPEGLDEIGAFLLEAVLANVGLNGVSGKSVYKATSSWMPISNCFSGGFGTTDMASWLFAYLRHHPQWIRRLPLWTLPKEI
jgi:hypothetical protein